MVVSKELLEEAFADSLEGAGAQVRVNFSKMAEIVQAALQDKCEQILGALDEANDKDLMRDDKNDLLTRDSAYRCAFKLLGGHP